MKSLSKNTERGNTSHLDPAVFLENALKKEKLQVNNPHNKDTKSPINY